METNKTQDYLLKKQIRKKAMDRISLEYPLTAEMLKKYNDELNWTKVSSNSSINWSIDMIKAFEYYIDWKEFSEFLSEKLLYEEVIDRFKDKWDWKALSSNSGLKLTYELLDRYIDRWDWSTIIKRGEWNEREELFSLEFLKRYQDRIPIEELEDSELWMDIVEKEMGTIKKEMILTS